MIQDFLNLPPLQALEIDDLGDHYRGLADGQAEPACCPQCQRDTMQGHGRQRQEFIDTPMHGKRVLIEIERRRYRCKIDVTPGLLLRRLKAGQSTMAPIFLGSVGFWKRVTSNRRSENPHPLNLP